MKIKTSLLTLILLSTGLNSILAQVGIGTTTPNASAALDISSTTQGLLLPRMTASQRNGIASPVQGLMVYCTNCGSNGEAQFYNGADWVNLVGGLAATAVLAIGDNYQGGKIAYILVSGDTGYDPNVQHGLIAATFDQSTSTPWGCRNTSISTATSIGTGNQNTINIMSGCSTAGIAARLCGDLVLNGYSDWYLPSRNELTKFYLNRSEFNYTLSYYLSSTQYDSLEAWALHFNGGLQDHRNKDHTFAVRAFRSF